MSPASAAKRCTLATANLGSTKSGRADRVAMPRTSEMVMKASAVMPVPRPSAHSA